jgi:multidrug efflux pump subunit AcrA (membrane-fusion protein)
MDAKKAQKLVDQVADNVRQAIDEAQRQAQDILTDAEAQAEKVRAEAERLRSEAERIRGDAEAEASRRLDEVQSALADLRGRLSGEVEPGPVTVPEPEPPQTPEPVPTPDPTPEPGPEPVPEPMPEPTPEPTPPPEVPQTAEPAASANGDEAVAGDDDGAARLVAMKLALEGTPREAAKEQLAADYDVADLDGLLDDVYSKAGK